MLRLPDPDAPATPPASSGRMWWLTLAIIVLLGGLARFWNLNWDGGAYLLHPDEWALNEVVRWLGPDLNPHFFFYGALPIYLDRATAEGLRTLGGLDWLAQEHVALIGRAYSALASTLLIPLVGVVGRRLWGGGAGLVAAACTAGAALLIQAAHFGTVDSAVTLAGLALLWIALHIAAGGGGRWYALAGAVLGLAVATKLTAASFLLLPLLAHGLRPAGRSRRAAGRNVLVLAGMACGTMLLGAPYYVLAWPELAAAVREQTAELSGGYQLAYTWQFIGSTPYVFELTNLVVWGLGLPLGLAALAGWLGALAALGARLVAAAQERRGKAGTNGQPLSACPAARLSTASLLLLTVWPTVYLLYVGTWEARFVRHLLPLVPFCALFATGGLGWLMTGLRGRSRPATWLARGLGVVVVAGAVAWGLAVWSIYLTPDTRLAATAWMRADLTPGTVLVVEDKNQLLPLFDATHPVDRYRYGVLPVTAPDTPAKMATFAGVLATGEVLVVPNRRWSAVLPRLPTFPYTGRYYRLLAGGDLGYTPLATFASPPRLGPLTWPDDAAEETFQVFDHPTVTLFRNTGHLSETALRARLQAAP